MSEEKTEQPSDKRLREAREKGDVAKSTEIISAVTVLAVVGYFIVNADSIFAKILSATQYTLENASVLPYDEALELIAGVVVGAALKVVAPVVSVVIVAAFASILAQIGFLFAPKAAMPKLENLNPAKWFKQVFSVKNLFEFVKNIIKVVVLSYAVYMATNNHITEIFKLPTADIGAVWNVTGALFTDLAIYAVVAFCILAALDFVYTKFKYTKDHMMSHEEVKREFKESEGDPHIKQKRKQLHQEMLNQGTIDKARKAKCIIVNPTHYAVAIDYEKGRTKLPVVLAKAQGDLARRMIEMAKEEGIPVLRQPPLARALFANAHEDEFVPSDLLLQVAEVLKIVATMDERNG